MKPPTTCCTSGGSPPAWRASHPGLEVQALQLLSEVIDEVVDLLDAVPVPGHLLLLVDTFHERRQPAVGSLDDVVLPVVNLEHVGVVRGADGIGDSVLVDQ